MGYPKCAEVEKIWGNCGWAEALPSRVRNCWDGAFRANAERFFEEDPSYFEWLKQFPTRYPLKAKKLAQSIREQERLRKGGRDD